MKGKFVCLETILYVLVLVCIALFLDGCEKEPIRIGFVGGISGRVADLGVGGRNGALLAVEERNAHGGINGRPVELIIRDDEQNPDTARKVAGELVGKNVEAIIGPMTSSMAFAILPIVNEARLVLLSPTVTSSDLSGLDDFFLRISPDTNFYVPKSAHFFYEKLALRRAALIYDAGNRPFTVSWLTAFRKTFEGLGGRVVAVDSFRSGRDVAFSPIVHNLMRHRPDLVIFLCSAVDAARLCQQVRKLAPLVTISVSEWASTEQFIEMGADTTEGVYIRQFAGYGKAAPRYRTFLKAYRKRFGRDPGFPAIAGYDAANLLMDSLADRKNGVSLKATILATRVFQGVQNRILLNRYGDCESTTFMTAIKSGRLNP